MGAPSASKSPSALSAQASRGLDNLNEHTILLQGFLSITMIIWMMINDHVVDDDGDDVDGDNLNEQGILLQGFLSIKMIILMLIIWMMIICNTWKGKPAAGFFSIAMMMICMDRGSCCKAFFYQDGDEDDG